MTQLLEVVRGDDSYIDIPVTAGGVAINLAAVQAATFTLKAGNHDDLPVLVTKTKADGDISVVDDASDNIVRIHLEVGDLDDAVSPFSIWWGELEVIEADARRSTPWQGKVKIVADQRESA